MVPDINSQTIAIGYTKFRENTILVNLLIARITKITNTNGDGSFLEKNVYSYAPALSYSWHT